MKEGIEEIGKKDVVWSYAATFFTIGAGIILLPFMLNKLPAETIGIWTVFQTISMLVFMLDFGFKPSFARNLSYIFSGVSLLKTEGVENVEETGQVNYSLLKGTLSAMKIFYRWLALLTLLLLSVAGTVYFHFLLKKYSGDHTDAIAAWVILIFINCYNIYTQYYDALLTGKGYIRQSQQINILGQCIYIILAIVLIYCGFGLTAIVASQLLSIVVRRVLSYRVFYTREMKKQLQDADTQSPIAILKAIAPNAVKSGLTSIGGFLVNKSSVFLASVFLPLSVVASLGITLQVLDILARCAVVMYTTILPKLAQYRVENDLKQLKKAYINCTVSLLTVFAVGGCGVLLFGNPLLELINSSTLLLPPAMAGVLLVIYALEYNHIIAAGFIMADNRIPFFIPSLLSGAATILLILTLVAYFDMGIWGMILAPGIAQLAYQNWKWPSVVIKELKNH